MKKEYKSFDLLEKSAVKEGAVFFKVLGKDLIFFRYSPNGRIIYPMECILYRQTDIGYYKVAYDTVDGKAFWYKTGKSGTDVKKLIDIAKEQKSWFVVYDESAEHNICKFDMLEL